MAGEAPSKKAEPTKEPTGKRSDDGKRMGSDRIRTIAARVVWVLFVLCALVLAVAALLYALDGNEDNSLVDLVYDIANGVDLGIFDLDNPIREFFKDDKETKVDVKKTALFNYGIGSILYLIVGRVVEKLIRP